MAPACNRFEQGPAAAEPFFLHELVAHGQARFDPADLVFKEAGSLLSGNNGEVLETW